MQIILSPIRGLPGEAESTVSVALDILTVDGADHDFSALTEGATSDPGDPFLGEVTRTGGEIVCTLRVSLGDTAQPKQSTDPADWLVVVTSGEVAIPAVRKPPQSPEFSPETAV